MRTIFSIAVALALLYPLSGYCAVLNVGAGQQYASISGAIAAAAPHDSIEVEPGTYCEDIALDKPLRLHGNNWPVISGSSSANAVLITADDVHLEGFVIRGAGSDMMHSDAGIKIHGDAARIKGNRIEGNLFGVYISACKLAVIEDNTIVGPRQLEMGSRGAGIHLYDTQQAMVQRNTVSFVRDGVYFDHADNNIVQDNEFHDLRYGVHYMYCGANEFYRNYFHDNVAGVAIMYTDGVVFSDNQIINNRNGYNAFGLLFQACNNCIAERNVIINNTSGIFLEGSRFNRITHNLIAYNDVGAVIYGSAFSNELHSNDFVGNLSTLRTVGQVHMDWAPAGVGNYYGDYSGYDLDQDGTGDIPHKLQDSFEFLEGNHPLLRLYLNSAAADALAAAERSFPLIEGSQQEDPAPFVEPVSGVRANAQASDPVGSRGPLALLVSALALLASTWLYWRLAR